MLPVRIRATGSHLPGAAIDNEHLERLVGPLPEDVLAGIQVERRHWIVDPATGEHTIRNSEMAARAARAALDAAGIAPSEVDLLVVSTSSPDYPLPPMVTLVQDALGIASCAAIEVRSGCAGAVEALDIARHYLAQGEYRIAVVIGSEAISPLLVPLFRERDPDSIRMRDRLVLYSFGDGAGAIVLTSDDADTGASDFLGSAMASVGAGRDPGMQVVGGGTHAPLHVQLGAARPIELRLDFTASASFGPRLLNQALAEVLRKTGVAAGSIDVCIIPEGNAGYVNAELEAPDAAAPEWASFQGRIVENLSEVGATGSAAVPLAIDDSWRRGLLQPGNRVLLLALETSKWMYAGTIVNWSAPAPSSAHS
jgi:3-oxoacyl-[acyl-carrier-protein] synthase III